jgi:hypothetical protein
VLTIAEKKELIFYIIDMSEEEKLKKENSNQTLFSRDSYNKTIETWKDRVTELEGIIRVLEDDKAERDTTLATLGREKSSWQTRAEKAEKLLNEGKPLESGKSYEDMKKETFEERFARKWEQATGRN